MRCFTPCRMKADESTAPPAAQTTLQIYCPFDHYICTPTVSSIALRHLTFDSSRCLSNNDSSSLHHQRPPGEHQHTYLCICSSLSYFAFWWVEQMFSMWLLRMDGIDVISFTHLSFRSILIRWSPTSQRSGSPSSSSQGILNLTRVAHRRLH